MGFFTIDLTEPKRVCLNALDEQYPSWEAYEYIVEQSVRFPVDRDKFLSLVKLQIEVDNRASIRRLINEVIPDYYPQLWLRLVLFPITLTVGVVRGILRLGGLS